MPKYTTTTNYDHNSKLNSSCKWRTTCINSPAYISLLYVLDIWDKRLGEATFTTMPYPAFLLKIKTGVVRLGTIRPLCHKCTRKPILTYLCSYHSMQARVSRDSNPTSQHSIAHFSPAWRYMQVYWHTFIIKIHFLGENISYSHNIS